MSSFTPGVIEINGKRCLIIADSVSHELPTSGTVLLEQVEGFTIFCLAEELVKKKAIHRGLPVYGYWQTLYASKLWYPDRGIAAYRHNNGGQYVAVDLDEKTATTGEVVDGVAIAAVGEQLDDKQIRWLEIMLQDITLPNRAAMTVAEQIAKQEKNNRTLLLTVFFALSALIFGWFSGSWFAKLEIRQAEEQRMLLATEVETMRATVAELKKIKLVGIPDQREILSLLESLIWIEGIEVPNSDINAVQLSVPYRSYTDTIYILAQHDIPYTERWLADGRVEINLR